MFNNNINKPAITVFLPLTSAKTSFCQWQKLKLVFAGKNYFCRDGFFCGKKPVFTGHWQKLANPGSLFNQYNRLALTFHTNVKVITQTCILLTLPLY